MSTRGISHVTVIVDTQQAHAERPVVRNRRQNARRPLCQREAGLALANIALHAWIILEASEITELVDCLPKVHRPRRAPVHPLLPPPWQVGGVERDFESSLQAQRPGDFRERRLIEIDLHTCRLCQQERFDLLGKARGPGPDLQIARVSRCATPQVRAGRSAQALLPPPRARHNAPRRAG